IKNWVCWVSSVLFLGLLGPLEVSALECEPRPGTPEQTDAMGVTVCEKSTIVNSYLSNEAQFTYPSNGLFSVTKDFQIRSCGRYNCDRAASFNVLSEGVTLVNNLANPTSKIPLTVSIKQKKNGATVTFSPDAPANTPCTSVCDFQGAGRTVNFCEECLDFELTLSADLNQVMEQGTLKQSGWHSGILTFTINQAPSSVGGSGDAGVDRVVNLVIYLLLPPLIRISGLQDMTLSTS
ncbi:hypothetical protein, partial [Endozoicomonas sp. ONNA2]|uniref:hypothetical protein n=1 Tax=Endozoicomonas sp. ONNA2 TaxID=2828741 RepID=UPI002147C6BE